jgi:serine/threonine protein kinase
MAVDAGRAKSLFLAASDLVVPAERAAFLDRECGGDAELRQRVEALLRANDAAPLPSAKEVATVDSADGLPATVDHGDPTARVGAVLAGKYKLVEEIGAGGMGSVFLAQQTEPVKRVVAVKVVKAGMDSKAVLARFDAERQALALMDHPNIARVLDAGTTEGGRPFFVMELVKGVPITQFCDQRKLMPRQRLELFVAVCQAIQHAHQKGIIHRDLKPSNVLVALYDDRAVPKVIDFGVAKATGASLTDMSLLTGFGAVVGTPEYMSPEQASLNNLDIDTRSDVYALGVLLYELLTGTTPVDKKSLKDAALLEVLRIVREVEAPRPSAKLSSIDTLPNVAANRGTEPARLSKLLKGELDWVVLKALEKDRTRRYETANGLARDLERYLADEVVEARPPSAGYRLQKFVRRHKGQVLAASVVLFALLAGVVGTSLGLVEAKRQEGIARDEAWAKEQARAAEAAQRQLAQANERKAVAAAAAELQAQQQANEKRIAAEQAAQAEAAARQKEEQERKFAQAIADFVINDFLALTSVEGQGRFGGAGLDRNTTLLDLLNRAAQKLKARKDLDPRIEAELCWIIGVNYRASGDARGVPFLERAVQLRRESLGQDHRDTLSAMNSLAMAYREAGKLDLAVPLLEQTLKRQKTKLGTEHHDTLITMNGLAMAYREAGKLDLALPLAEETVKLMKAKLGTDHPNTLTSMGNLAVAYQGAGQWDLALPLFKETLQLMKAKLGADHLDTLICMHNLAQTYRAAGKLDLAVPLFEETLQLQKAKLGTDHHHTLGTMSDLAGAYQAAGMPDLAPPLLEEALKLHKAKLGADHPQTLTSMNDLAAAYYAVRKLDLALPLFEETLKLRKAKLGADHPATLTTMNNLGLAYKDTGKVDLALPLLEETLKLHKAKLGADHPDTLLTMNNLATAYHAAGKVDLALSLWEETLKLQKAKLGADHPQTLPTMHNLAIAYWRMKRLDQSIPLLEEMLNLSEKRLGRQHPDTLVAVVDLGVNYMDAARFKEALPLLEEAYAASKKHPQLRFAGPRLVEAYAKTGETAKLANLLLEQLAEARKTLPKDSPQLAAMLAQVGMELLKLNKGAEAEPLLRECLAIREKLDPDHPETLNTMNSLGVAYWQMRQLDKSIPLFEKLLKGREAKLGRDHPTTLESVANLGVNYRDAGRLQEAIPLLEEAYRASKKHPALSWVGRELLDAYTKAGETAKIANLLLEHLPEARKALPKDSPQLAGLLAQIGLGLLEQKKWAEAEPLLRECLSIREKTQPDAWTTFNTQSLLGGALLGQKKYAEAEPLLLKGYEGMKTREQTIPQQGGAEWRVPEALDRLIELYTALNQPGEAKKWRAERAKYPPGKTKTPQKQ